MNEITSVASGSGGGGGGGADLDARLNTRNSCGGVDTTSRALHRARRQENKHASKRLTPRSQRR